jgi:SAM-dependent methyltransferase
MDQIQRRTTTSYDRYPKIFKKSVDIAMKRDGKQKILSFGCSSGLEVKTLSEKYFQNHEVYGCDIDSGVLQEAIENCRSIVPPERFAKNLEEFKVQFDFIFAMSVLCIWPQSAYVTNVNELYRFEKFQSDVDELSKRLKVGGYLIIHNANFYFEDTFLFNSYAGVKPVSNSSQFGRVPRFDKEGNLFPCKVNSEGFFEHTERKGFVFFERLQ